MLPYLLALGDTGTCLCLALEDAPADWADETSSGFNSQQHTEGCTERYQTRTENAVVIHSAQPHVQKTKWSSTVPNPISSRFDSCLSAGPRLKLGAERETYDTRLSLFIISLIVIQSEEMVTVTHLLLCADVHILL